MSLQQDRRTLRPLNNADEARSVRTVHSVRFARFYCICPEKTIFSRRQLDLAGESFLNGFFFFWCILACNL